MDKIDIKIPFYQLHTLYAITLNPSDNFMKGCKTEVNQVSRIREFISKQLDGNHYLLEWDVSCPIELKNGQHPRLHLHGVINFVQKHALRDFLLVRLKTLSNHMYIKIGPVNDLIVWKKYCQKYNNIFEYTPMVKHITWDKLIKTNYTLNEKNAKAITKTDKKPLKKAFDMIDAAH